jgi:hypothetical protein
MDKQGWKERESAGKFIDSTSPCRNNQTLNKLAKFILTPAHGLSRGGNQGTCVEIPGSDAGELHPSSHSHGAAAVHGRAVALRERWTNRGGKRESQLGNLLIQHNLAGTNTHSTSWPVPFQPQHMASPVEATKAHVWDMPAAMLENCNLPVTATRLLRCTVVPSPCVRDEQTGVERESVGESLIQYTSCRNRQTLN